MELRISSFVAGGVSHKDLLIPMAHAIALAGGAAVCRIVPVEVDPLRGVGITCGSAVHDPCTQVAADIEVGAVGEVDSRSRLDDKFGPGCYHDVAGQVVVAPPGLGAGDGP